MVFFFVFGFLKNLISGQVRISLITLNLYLINLVYLILRCPGCSGFTYVDSFRQHRLCPSCGEIIKVKGAPVYLEVKDYRQAEAIVNELGKYLIKNKRRDLTKEEKEKIREEYADWMRKNLMA